jgi:hypothetical protein
MANVCNQCFMSTCPHAADNTVVCTAFTPAPNGARLANGNYSAPFRNTLPLEVRNLDGAHIDNLVGGTNVVAPVVNLTAAEQAIFDDIGTITQANLGTARSVADKRPAKRNEIIDQLNSLLNGPPAAATVTNVNSAIEAIRALDVADNARGGVTSTTEYKQVNFPLATLFQSIVKAVERGTEVIPDQREMLDPTNGKKYIPFEKATKASCDANLVYSVHIFITTVTALKKEAPQVYHTFANEVRRVCVATNFSVAHEYADAILRGVDGGVFANIKVLFAAGEHNRIYEEVREHSKVKRKPDDQPRPGDPRPRIKFGPVATPVGGPGAGVITDYSTGRKKKCTRFHASPQQPCSAGLPDGDPRWAGKVGWCAFEH